MPIKGPSPAQCQPNEERVISPWASNQPLASSYNSIVSLITRAPRLVEPASFFAPFAASLALCRPIAMSSDSINQITDCDEQSIQQELKPGYMTRIYEMFQRYRSLLAAKIQRIQESSVNPRLIFSRFWYYVHNFLCYNIVRFVRTFENFSLAKYTHYTRRWNVYICFHENEIILREVMK